MAAQGVQLHEVALSDGLVTAGLRPPAELRTQLVEGLADCGLPYIEAAALDVSGAGESPTDPAALLCAEVLAERAEQTFAGMVRSYEAYSLLRRTALDAISLRLALKTLALAEGWELQDAALAVDRMELWLPGLTEGGYGVRAVLVDGLDASRTGYAELEQVVGALLEGGIDQVCLGDAVGDLPPRAVRELCRLLVARYGSERLGVRPNDAFGRGLVTLGAAYEGGVRAFDTCLGGIGVTRVRVGDVPAEQATTAAPESSPPVFRAELLATEDVVALLGDEGIRTGVDLPNLVRTGRFALEHLGVPSRSRYASACDERGVLPGHNSSQETAAEEP